MSLKTPVLFIVFNRPQETEIVFEAIRKAQPEKLYVSADGPRPGREDDATNCALVKQIAAKVDWPCDVKYNFQKENLGCRFGPVSGMDWFFENEEFGIVLEDDCLPNSDFFIFCQEMLQKYRYDERVLAVCGRNPLGKSDISSSYLFSRTFKEWGWASWKRAWKYNKIDAKTFDQATEENIFERIYEDKVMSQFLFTTNKSVHYENHVAWDYVWQFNILSQHGLVIVPAVNLVKNIGLNTGTHFGVDERIVRSVFQIDNFPLAYPVKHPAFVFADHKFDRDCFYKIHPYLLPKQYGFAQRVKDSLKYRIGKLTGNG